MKRLIFVLPALVMVALMAALVFALGHDPKFMPSTLINKPLPALHLAGLTPNDPVLDSGDLRGKPRLLNVFASWCTPCQIEHPVLMDLRAQGVEIIGIDWKEAAAAGSSWLAQKGSPYQMVGSDPSGRAGIDLGVTGVPETFLIDSVGRVRFRYSGPITPEIWQSILEPQWRSIGGAPTSNLPR